jgi:hypothetical protein
LARRLIHQRSVRLGPLVLETTPLKPPTPMVDRDRTVSRRSEPSSRTALMGEQPNPWDLLQPQDATSRHRTLTAVTGGRRLYLHPAWPEARGRRVVALIDFAPRGRRDATSALTGLSRYGVTCGNVQLWPQHECCFAPDRLPTVLPTFWRRLTPRHWVPPLLADTRSPSLAIHPRFEVPNTSVDVDSWEV